MILFQRWERILRIGKLQDLLRPFDEKNMSRKRSLEILLPVQLLASRCQLTMRASAIASIRSVSLSVYSLKKPLRRWRWRESGPGPGAGGCRYPRVSPSPAARDGGRRGPGRWPATDSDPTPAAAIWAAASLPVAPRTRKKTENKTHQQVALCVNDRISA